MDLMLQEGGRFGPHGSGSSLQDLTKDLEAKSGLKAAAVGAGAQMLQLGEGDETPGPAQSRLLTQLTQVELDWARLLADVPAVQTALQEVRTPPVPGPPPTLLGSSSGFTLLVSSEVAEGGRPAGGAAGPADLGGLG